MNEITCGFINENNIMIGAATFVEGDTETMERVKNEYNAIAYYQMNLEKELILPGEAYWNGTRFVWQSPNPDWVWSEEANNWIPPKEST